MKKVVYVCYEPVTAKVERDWYIDSLISRGIDVEYWDCSSIFYHKLEIPDELERDYVVKIKDYDHFESLLKLKDNLNTAYIMLIIYELKAFKLYRLLTRYKCRLYFIKWAVFPHKNRIVSKLVKFPFHPVKLSTRVFDKMFTVITKKAGFVKPFKKVFYAGSAALSATWDSQKKVPINLCDYDNYILSLNVPNELSGKSYAIFLDVNLPFHPDFQLTGKGHVDLLNYFEAMNRFFGFIERKFDVQVVIAGHPSSNYQDDSFKGRRIIKHITPVLVRDARFVISHHSASVSYAALNMKPIVFIYTNEMDRLYRDSAMPIIKGSAEFLNATIYNIDTITDPDQITIRDVDEERYNTYRYTFLTSKETEKTLSREIFFREIVT